VPDKPVTVQPTTLDPRQSPTLCPGSQNSTPQQ
jgi:hypothetical protein